MKKKCAKEALRYIKNNTIIGLGGGSTISYLISFIKEAGLNIEVPGQLVKYLLHLMVVMK